MKPFLLSFFILIFGISVAHADEPKKNKVNLSNHSLFIQDVIKSLTPIAEEMNRKISIYDHDLGKEPKDIPVSLYKVSENSYSRASEIGGERTILWGYNGTIECYVVPPSPNMTYADLFKEMVSPYPFNQKESKFNLTKEELYLWAFYHSLGHCFNNNNEWVKGSGFQFMQSGGQAEAKADAFAVMMLLKSGMEPQKISTIADARAISIGSFGAKYGPLKKYEYIILYTTPSILKINDIINSVKTMSLRNLVFTANQIGEENTIHYEKMMEVTLVYSAGTDFPEMHRNYLNTAAERTAGNGFASQGEVFNVNSDFISEYKEKAKQQFSKLLEKNKSNPDSIVYQERNRLREIMKDKPFSTEEINAKSQLEFLDSLVKNLSQKNTDFTGNTIELPDIKGEL